METSANQLAKAGCEIRLAAHADNLLAYIALMEQEQSRDGADSVFGGQRLLVVDVDLADLDLVGEFIGQFVQNGCDHLARTTPFGPEVDEDGSRSLQYFRCEIGLC